MGQEKREIGLEIWQRVNQYLHSATQFNITNLIEGRFCEFRIFAKHDIGCSLPSTNSQQVVAKDPDQPQPPEIVSALKTSVHLVRPITKCIWFVLVPNDEISFGLVWFSLAGQLPNAICFGLVPNGKIIFGLLWFSLTGQLPNVICFGLVTNEIISFGPICFGLAIQLPNGFCFGLVLNQIRPNDFGFVLCLNKWLLTFSHTHAHILTYTNSHSHT